MVRDPPPSGCLWCYMYRPSTYLLTLLFLYASFTLFLLSGICVSSFCLVFFMISLPGLFSFVSFSPFSCFLSVVLYLSLSFLVFPSLSFPYFSARFYFYPFPSFVSFVH